MNTPKIDSNIELKIEKLKAEYQKKGFKCEITTSEPGEDWDSQEEGHEAEEVYILLEGELELSLGGKTYRPAVGEVFVVPPHEPHNFKSNKFSRYYWIYDYDWEDGVTGVRKV